MSQTKVKFTDSKFLVESAMMIAIATVLSMIKIIDMPYGGSVTIASMLPIVIISYRYGIGKGLLVGLAYGVVQQLLGLENFSVVPNPTVVKYLAVVCIDYLLAFSVLGLGGIFRGKLNSQQTELVLGALLVGILRYVCHCIAGSIAWHNPEWTTLGPVIYSISYNTTYMVPEILVLVLIAWYVARMLDLSAAKVTIKKDKTSSAGMPYAIIGMLIILGCLIADMGMIFVKLQNEDNGELMLEGYEKVKWMRIAIFTAISFCAGFGLIFYSKKVAGKASENNK